MLAFGVRILPWFWGAPHWWRIVQTPDCFGYHQAAVNLLTVGNLSVSPLPPYAPDSFRTPVYPLFLVAVYTVFGFRPAVAAVFQVLLSSLSTTLVDRLATRLAGPRVALWAAVFWALDLPSITLSLMLLTETLAVFLFLVVCLLLVSLLDLAREGGPAGAGSRGGSGADERSEEPPTPGCPGRPEGDLPVGRAALTGISLGVLALTRPAFLYFVLFLPVVLLPIGRPRVIAALWLALFASFLVPVGAWIARNRISTGVAEFSSIQSMSAIERAQGTMARVWNVPPPEAARRLEIECRAELKRRGLDPIHLATIRGEIGRRVVLEHPGAYLLVWVRGNGKAFLGLCCLDLLKQFGVEYRGVGAFELGRSGRWTDQLGSLSRGEVLVFFAESGCRLLVVILGLIGLILALARREGTLLCFVVPQFVYIGLISGALNSHYRLRMPVTPAWCILAGIGIVALIERLRPADRA